MASSEVVEAGSSTIGGSATICWKDVAADTSRGIIVYSFFGRLRSFILNIFMNGKKYK